MQTLVLVTFFAALLPAALCLDVNPDAEVQCFIDDTCEGDTLTTTALECCTIRNGDRFQLTNSDQCLRCLVFGFQQTAYSLSGAGSSFSLVIELEKFVSAGDRNALSLEVTPQNLTPTDLRQIQYFNGFPRQAFLQFTGGTTGSYDIVVGGGDDTALEPDLQFQLALANTVPISGAGIINRTPTVSVSIQDPDEVGVFFSAAEFRVVEGNPPSAGGTLNANVNRENKALARDLIVMVNASVIMDLSLTDQDLAEPEDFRAEVKTVVFPRTVGSGGEIILALPAEFQVMADDVNEADEVFLLKLSTADGAGINFSDQPMSLGVIENDDGISGGFVERNQPAIFVAEGNGLSLTLEAIAELGATQTELGFLPAAVIDSLDVDTTLNVDYTVNAASDFTVSANGTIQSITFTAVNTIPDDIIEGDEMFIVRARGIADVYEITGTNGLVAVNIVDGNSATISFEMLSYNVGESQQYVEIAIRSSGARYAQGTRVSFYVITSTEGLSAPATSISDFTEIGAFEVSFSVQGPTSLSSFEVGRFNLSIVDDQLAESTEEVKLQLVGSSRTPSSLPVTVSTQEAMVRIIDDDESATITFVQSEYIVSEGSAEVLIEVRFSGTLDSSVTVNVLGQQESGVLSESILFDANTPNQIRTVRVEVLDDSIALEPNKQYEYQLLGISDTRVQLGSIATTTVTIVDDDDVTVQFTPLDYSFLESDGTVTVGIEITSAIAQQLSVFVSGGPGLNQPGGVAVSGVTIAQTVIFVASGSLSQSISFTLTDDSVTDEPDEVYSLNFSDPNPVITLGSAAMITIMDDDNAATIRFVQSTYTFSEGVSGVQVEIELIPALSTPLTIRVLGEPGSQPSTVVTSGAAIDQTITFQAGQTTATLIFALTDDEIGLEDDEFYQLRLTEPSPSINIGLGGVTNITITDDEVVTVSFEQASYTFSENSGTGLVQIILSAQIARDFQVRVVGGPGAASALVVNSGTNVDQTVLFQAGSTLLSNSISFSIIDDEFGLEDMEVYELVITERSSNDVAAVPYERTVVTIIDDEIATVSVTEVTTRVSESDDDVVLVCAMYTGPSRLVRDITVTFVTQDGSALDGDDYEGGQKQAIIQADSLISSACVTYDIISDNETESSEYFLVEISTVEPSGSTAISQSQTTRVTITDSDSETPIPMVTCSYFQATRFVSTFDGTNSYGFNAPCEHALLVSEDFGIFIDSLDGSVTNSRIGIRDGSASIVIDLSGNILFQTGQLTGINITTSNGQTRVQLPGYGIVITLDSTQISIQVSDSFSMTSVFGLCGDLNGNLVLQDGTFVDANDQAALQEFIEEYFILPGETFVRQTVRRECGLLANDTESGDPTFMVPLDTGSGNSHEYALCYEIFGSADQYFNFISDTCVSVNAYYGSVPENRVGNYRQHQNFVKQIFIRASGESQACVNIAVSLGDDGFCTTTVDSGVQTTLAHGGRYSSDGISVRAYSTHARITVPNCENVQLIMKATCKVTKHGLAFIEFRVTRGLNLHPTSHGLIGQFWNIPASVTKYNGFLRDGKNYTNTYLIELQPPEKPVRRFVGFLYSAWDYSFGNCLYAGDSNGGATYELSFEDDSVIEGKLDEYVMESDFDTSFTYSEFDESAICKTTS